MGGDVNSDFGCQRDTAGTIVRSRGPTVGDREPRIENSNGTSLRTVCQTGDLSIATTYHIAEPTFYGHS
eukprot:5054617-Pyramimonas_sp.AAC.1